MKTILKDRVLVEKIKSETKTSVLDIVEDENAPSTGKVELIGKNVNDVIVGDVIKYKESDSLPIYVNGKNMYILREYDIIGIL